MDPVDIARILSSSIPSNSAETARIKSGIECLTEKIGQLQYQLEQHRAALSPARFTPLEIIGEVFKLMFPEPTLGRHERETLVNLGLVCRRWRRASLLVHELWSGIRIGEEQLGSYQKVVAWISRAGELPKTIKFIDEVEEDEDEGDSKECLGKSGCMQHHPTLIKLLTEGPALDCVGLSGITAECLQHVKRSVEETGVKGQRPWDTLKSLELNFRTSTWRRLNDPTKSIFYGLPPVTSLCLCLPCYVYSVERYFPLFQLHIPATTLQNLITFELTGDWHVDTALLALEHCLNIEELKINNTSSYYTSSKGLIPMARLLESGILLPRLRVLQLAGQHPDMEILDYVVTPTLRNLELNFSMFEIECDCDEDRTELAKASKCLSKQVLKFLRRSNCQSSVQSLRIENRDLPPEEIALVLLELPALTHLVLRGVDTDYVRLWRGLRERDLKDQTLPLGCLRMLNHIELLQLERMDAKARFNTLIWFLARPTAAHPIHLTLSFYELREALHLRDDGDEAPSMSDRSSQYSEDDDGEGAQNPDSMQTDANPLLESQGEGSSASPAPCLCGGCIGLAMSEPSVPTPLLQLEAFLSSKIWRSPLRMIGIFLTVVPAKFEYSGGRYLGP